MVNRLNTANNFSTTLASAIIDSDTEIEVTSSLGCPTAPFLATIDSSEIIKVTAVSGTTWTVVRAQESTTATGYNAGITIEHCWTAGNVSNIYTELDEVEGNIINIKYPPNGSGLTAATGDGVADDTAAFTAALAYCESNSINLEIPPGDYLITSELPFPHRYGIRGHGYNSNLVLNLSKDEFCFKDLSNWRYSFSIKNLRFSVASGGEKNVGAIAVESVIRGGVLKDIWTFDIHQPFYLGAQVWGVVSAENIFCYLLAERTSDEVAFYCKGNTIMMDNIEIIGDFYTGLQLESAAVFKLNGFNISGSGSYQLMKAINLDTASHGCINSGWIETLDSTYANGEGHAIYCTDSSTISIDGVNVASGSIFSDNSTVEVKSVSFGQMNGGLQVLNDGKIITTSDNIKYHNASYLDGEIVLTDITPIANGILPNPVLKNNIATTGFIASTNASFASLADDTTNYQTGDRSKEITCTGDFHGVKLTLNNVTSNKLYTIVAQIKQVSGIDSAYAVKLLPMNDTAMVSTYPATRERTGNTDWHLLMVPCLTATTTLEARIITKRSSTDPAIFLLDSIDVFEGYNPFDLNKYTAAFLRNNQVLKNTAAPSGGTWVTGDKVYNSTPAATGYEGWICVSGGTPGTWKGFGVIET